LKGGNNGGLPMTERKSIDYMPWATFQNCPPVKKDSDVVLFPAPEMIGTENDPLQSSCVTAPTAMKVMYISQAAFWSFSQI
jgi:hypothetical protein